MSGFVTALLAFYIVTIAAFVYAALTAPVLDDGTVD
jgi:hypothetical protein